jgi:predicted nuclease of predicted toxin-antitoxin system
MRLLLDEQLSPAIAEQLRARGYDIVFATEAGVAGATDEKILSSAARDRRAVVTNNIKDFRPLHADYLGTNTTHYGIVYIATRKYSLRREQLGPLITALGEFLSRLPAEDALQDREYFL